MKFENRLTVSFCTQDNIYLCFIRADRDEMRVSGCWHMETKDNNDFALYFFNILQRGFQCHIMISEICSGFCFTVHCYFHAATISVFSCFYNSVWICIKFAWNLHKLENCASPASLLLCLPLHKMCLLYYHIKIKVWNNNLTPGLFDYLDK